MGSLVKGIAPPDFFRYLWLPIGSEGTAMKKELETYQGILIQSDTGLHQQIAALVTEVLPPGASILDWGCGQGALSQRLADLGFRVQAVDLSAADFRASVPFENLDFNDGQQLAAFLRKYESSFDLILGVEVIEHLENPWQYMRNLRHLVKPGGFLLLSTPNITSWVSRVNFFFRGRFHQFEDADRAYGHIAPIAQDELTIICEKLGLRIVKFQPGGRLPRFWPVKNPRRMIEHLFGFLGTFFMTGYWRGWCLIALIERPGEETPDD